MFSQTKRKLIPVSICHSTFLDKVKVTYFTPYFKYDWNLGMFNFEAKQIAKEKEMNMRIEQKRKQEKSQRQLIKENIIVLLNQDII